MCSSSVIRMNNWSHTDTLWDPWCTFIYRVDYRLYSALFLWYVLIVFHCIIYSGPQTSTAAEPHSGLLPLDQPAQHGQCVHPDLWDLWAGAWWRWLPLHGLCLPGDIWLLSSPLASCDGESQKKPGERKQIPANRSPVISLFLSL